MAQRAPLQSVRPNRIPPHNLDAEQSVLGAMLESKDAIANVLEILGPHDFYKPAHTDIYEAILALFSRSEAADAITVADELARRGKLEQIGGKPYISGLLEAYPTASSAAYYARIVGEHALLRRLIVAGNQVQELGFGMPDDVELAVDQAEEIVYEVANRRLHDDLAPIRPLLSENMEIIERLYEQNEHLTGMTSGFDELDDITAGFQPSNLIIVAARPGMGKTSLLNDFALACAMNRRGPKPVVIFSLEMSRHEVVRRFLSSVARVDSQRIGRGSLQEQDWMKLSRALGRLAEAPILIDDSANINLMEIRAKCRRIKTKQGLGLIIIDYLQLMQSPRRSENRQQEVSEISRGLKILARDLEVPVVCASQLNRGVEARADKRPLLGDLRESGCLTGDTLVAVATGELVPIRDLVDKTPEVVAVDRWQVDVVKSSKVWKTGTKPVFRLRTATGREISATTGHPFLTIDGWRPLGSLQPGDRIAVPRQLPQDPGAVAWDPERVVLLAHVIGDGSCLRNLPLRYASSSDENIAAVIQAAKSFGVTARVDSTQRCKQVFLPAPYRLTHKRRNPIAAWLDELGLFDKRAHEKFVPGPVFRLPTAQVALFLRHLWATDGCVWLRTGTKGPHVRIYYSTSSRRLAGDVQHLLVRLGITARVRSLQKEGYRPNYHVTVDGRTDQLMFAEQVGGHGDRAKAIERAVQVLLKVKPNPNNDTIPKEIWDRVKERMRERGISQRAMQSLRATTYGGTSHFRFAPSRAVLAEYASVLEDAELKQIAGSDLYWDAVVSIEAAGVEDVFDMTVPGAHNFVANGIVVHNSIEQDSDIVMFLYRDELYNPDTEFKGEAELIVAKHRNGPTGKLRLSFMSQYTKFAEMAKVVR